MRRDRFQRLGLHGALVGALSATVVLGLAAPGGAAGTASSVPGPQVLAVGACASENAAGGPGPYWVPSKLVGLIPPNLVGSLEYYSIGSETLLGPRGWNCAQLTAGDGAAAMAVYPPGVRTPITGSPPGAQVVDAQFEYTGHGPGYDLVCPYFPNVSSGISPNPACDGKVPSGEQVSQVTPDVVSITDPPRVKGNLDASGGALAVTGYAIAPQGPNLNGSIDVAVVSCALRQRSLCPAILGDFVVRQLPVPVRSPGP